MTNVTGIVRLILRNCNLSGELPGYVWSFNMMEMLDVSFNKLTGKISSTITSERLRFVFLTGNLLSGDVPDSILKQGSNIDLSYNNFEPQGHDQPACRDNMNLNLNLYRSSSAINSTRRSLPCMESVTCPRYSNCLHVNSGGKDLTIKENKTTTLYEGDVQVFGGTARYFLNEQSYWGFSSTGDFMDDNDYQNTRYTVSLHSSSAIPDLYSTARIAPNSLTYFHYCLENGTYTVRLHFAEIVFTDDRTFTSLGKRIFDVYIQEKLVLKDFNIEDKAGGAQKPLIIPIANVSVTSNVLEIRFYYAGKGTTRIPDRGVYGPIVSAISVVSDDKVCSNPGGDGGNNGRTITAVAAVLGAFGLMVVILGILWWNGCLPGKCSKRKGTDDAADLPKGTFSLKQIIAATNDFDYENKIGEGGFGPVYKGMLPDRTMIAVKQLSSKSRQGNREFLNEIGMISCMKHPNLVKLHGFCVEGDQLLLVYEYMENNSLANAIFGRENSKLKLDWPTRFKICVGIAKGLAFLHEESRLKIVHRDIKATNVLLDKDLTPKISDFGLARLDEEEKSHISTRVAGTIGYMAPEYALWGYLTDKADVYSFGVLTLEIVSGKNNNGFIPSNDCVCLLDWACQLQQNGNLLPIIDETLKSEVKKDEAEIMIKIGLLCTNASPTLRPTMSEVVNMLQGKMAVPDTIPEPSCYTDDLRFKALRDLKRHGEGQSQSHGYSQNSTTLNTLSSSFVDDKSTQEFYEINPNQHRANPV
ncbi:Probable LRR receptor-like serine/threonine-protein kinase RFK1 [Linum grandiflorum]